MSEIQENAAHLAQTIGPRPAGTEEERQAALYLAEAFQRKAGLAASIEDFNCSVDYETPRAICCAIAIIASIFTLVFPVLVIPSLILCLIASGLYVIETLVRPVLSRAISHGVSQNVVAKYEPKESLDEKSVRHRKIIIVSHYDTGKVRSELKSSIISIVPIIRWAELVAMVLLFCILVIRLIAVPTAVFLTTINVVTIVAAVIALLPLLNAFMHKQAPYNDGANCNASGIAVMLEVAGRLVRGREKTAMQSPASVRHHGERTIKESGFVPESAQLVYDVDVEDEDETRSPEERLMAAKAAVAMLTGKPVSAKVNIDFPEDATSTPAKSADTKDPLASLFGDVSTPVQAPASAELGESQPIETLSQNSVAEQPVTFMLSNSQALYDEANAVLQGDIETKVAPQESSAYPSMMPASLSQEDEDVPDWFKSARAKARKNVPVTNAPVHRSRYTEAIEAAEREIVERQQAEQEQQQASETEARLQQIRESLMQNYPQRAQGENLAEDGAVENADGQNPVQEAKIGETTAFPMLDIDPDMLRREAEAQVQALDSLSLVPGVAQEDTASKPLATPQAEEPSVAVSNTVLSPEETKARSEAAERAKKLRALIPQIGAAKNEPPQEQLARQNALRQSLPSLSGSIKIPDSLAATTFEVKSSQSVAVSSKSASSSTENTDAFAAVEVQRAFPLVGENIFNEENSEDLYIEDADDSVYDGQITQTGAITGVGYVDMPKSRGLGIGKLFNRSKKHQEPESSAAEWLDVDEDFDARKVGEARGSWKSFRQDDDVIDDAFNEEDDFDSRDWNGGAFSVDSLRKIGGKLKGSSKDKNGYGANDRHPYDDADYGYDEGYYEDDIDTRMAEEDATSSRRVSRFSQGLKKASDFDNLPLSFADSSNDMQAVRDFRHPDINVEVWFVALGAELSANSGMEAFLTEHKNELKGAIIIDIASLGAGELSIVEREGTYFPVKSSSRMQRYIRKAASAIGMKTPGATMFWINSAATYAMRHGCQAMHLVGMRNGKPAYFAERDDTIDKVSDEAMLLNADFLIELLKSI